MAEMWEVIIKNNGASNILVEDLGIDIPSASSIDFHEQYTYDEIAGSDDLRNEVNLGNLVVNDGTGDLVPSAGENYLTLENIYHLEDNYYDKTDLYTKIELDAGQLDNRYYTETELDAGQLDNRYYTETELETSGQSSVHWDNLTDVPSFAEHNTLDEAYNEGGAGLGRTVSVDSGSVKLSGGDGGYSPLELTEQATLPTLDLAGGQLSVKDGILYAYDSTRSKWLSVQRMFLAFGRKGKTKNQWLAFGSGRVYSNNSGFRLARNATIISITGQLDSSGTCDIRLRKNDVATNISTLNITAAIGDEDTSIDVDLSASDYLQSYLEAASNVEDPVVIVELAWRE